MGYWKSKVAPKIKKIFDKDGKKAAAADFSKSFNKVVSLLHDLLLLLTIFHSIFFITFNYIYILGWD